MQSPQQKLEVSDMELNQSYNSSGLTPDRPLRQEDLSMRTGHSGSSTRRLHMEEKQKLLREAEDEYRDLLKQMQDDENLTAEDIANFKKNALIHKSVLDVRKRARELQQNRGSPQRYHQVQSKVGQNIKTAVTVNSIKVNANTQSIINLTAVNQRSPTQSQFMSPSNTKSYKMPQQREKPFDITEEEYITVKQVFELSDVSQKKLSDRDRQIRQCEEQLQQIMQEMGDKKTMKDKLQTFQEKKALVNNFVEDIKLEEQKVEESAMNKVTKKSPQKVGMRPGGVNGQKLEQAKQEPQVQTMSVQKKAQGVGMRPGGVHGSQLKPQAETFTVDKGASKKVGMRPKEGVTTVKKQEKPKQEMRPNGKHGKELTQQKEEQDPSVLQVVATDEGKRIDLVAPEGANGCVMFIESRASSRANSRSASKQGTSTMQVKKKQGAQMTAYNPQAQPVVKEKTPVQEKEESIQSEEISEDRESTQNFGRVAQVSAKRIEDMNRFQNRDLAQKTLEIQDEFERVLHELNHRRQHRDGEAFYHAINEYYQEGNEQHSSPVRRLIQHKNTTFEHKQTMKDNINKGEYAFVYTTGPEKSYVIEPHGGINYNLAKKDPNRFYEQVFQQDITKHTVGKDKEVRKQIEEEQERRLAQGEGPLKKSQTKVPVTVKSKVTKRPHLKIMEKLRAKIASILQKKMADLGYGTILAALKDKTIEEQIKELVKQDKLQIVDQQNNVIYDNEMKEVLGVSASKRKASQQIPSRKQSNMLDEVESSPHIPMEDSEYFQDDSAAQTKTQLKIADKDLKRIETKVRDHFKRTNSFKN